MAHALPPAYVERDPSSGSITGLHAASLAAEVEDLKTTVGWLHEKLSKTEARVVELEEAASGGGEEEFVDAVSKLPSVSSAGTLQSLTLFLET